MLRKALMVLKIVIYFFFIVKSQVIVMDFYQPKNY